MTTTTLAYLPSPSQGVWHLGPLPIRAYALFIIVGIVVALVIGDRRWEARGGERGVIYDIALWAVPFGLIGGRLYHVITDWTTYFGDGGAGLGAALRVWDGGLGIWGAVALGGVGAWIGCRRRGIPLPAFGDAIAPGIVLAQAIGRLGNYFNQELYGRPTTLPWGLEIYERRDASGALDSLNGVSTGQPLIPGVEAVHPTFLYELLWNILVFVVLIVVDRRFKIGHGRLFALYVAGYCIGRFWIELMRTDEATTIDGIRINSFTSAFVFIGAAIYIMVAPKGREDPSTLAGEPEEVEEEEEEEADTSVEEFVKELAGVASTTGVVAAAKVAGDKEDEDARAVGDVTEEPEAFAAAAEAEAEAGATVAEVEAEASEPVEPEAMQPDVAEPEAVELAGDEAAEPVAEVSAEAEALAEDVAVAPAEVIEEAEEFAEAGEEAEAAEAEADATETEAVAPEDVVAQAEASEETLETEAPEPEPVEPEAMEPDVGEPEAVAVAVAEAAVEAEALAEDVAEAPSEDIVAAEEFPAAGEEVEAVEPETESVEPAVEPEPEVVDEAEQSEAEADAVVPQPEVAEAAEGLGAVEGEEAVEAQEAEAVAAEVAAEEPVVVASEPEVADEADEPEAETVATEVAPDSDGAETYDAETIEPHAADQSGSRLRRWWRGRRGR